MAARRDADHTVTRKTTVTALLVAAAHAPASERFQILDELPLRALREVEIERVIVVVDYGAQRGEAAVVIETAFHPGEEPGQRGRAIPSIRGAGGLEVV